MNSGKTMHKIAAVVALALLSAAAQAAGNAKQGEIIYGRCGACHTVEKGGGNGLGPNLFGVVGRKAGSVANFPYSPALKNSKIVWTEANLSKWVADPQKMVPGTRMIFNGLRNKQEIDDLVAYLKSKK